MNSSTVGPFGLKTSVDDLFRWNENFRQNRLPRGTHLSAFFEEGSLIDNENCLSSYPRQRYKGLEHIWYTGGGPGFMAHFVRFPKHDFSVVVLCNLSEEDEWHDMVRIIGKIADRYLASHLESSSKNDDWDDAAPITIPLAEMKNRIGGYRKPDGSFVRIDTQGEILVLKEINRAFPAKEPLKLTPLSANRFRIVKPRRSFDLIFDTSPDSGRGGIRVTHQGGRTEQWSAAEFVTPSKDALNDYCQDFRCDDIESTYQFSVDRGSLFVRLNAGRRRRLVPTVHDVFVPATGKWDNMKFVFSRDRAGSVNAFRLHFFRVRLDFDRLRKDK